ncbi:MAG: MFS transporter [Pseudomonadota bacterium]
MPTSSRDPALPNAIADTVADAMTMGATAPFASEKKSEILKRATIIALIAFLTLIDLFGSQALLPTLVEAYGVTPAEMGFAVNASTIGMAVAGVVVALLARRIDRKRWIWLSLALLSIPTFLIGLTDDLTVFTLLRVAQGIFMSAAFTLTLTYLSEECSVTAAAGAMAAYITGNVASNLFGRLMAAGIADNFGLSESFFAFSALNLVGAAIAFFHIGASSGAPKATGDDGSILAAWADHFRNARLRAAFGIGFIILFAFVGTFTYVNFVLAMAPFSLPQASIGLVYFVFLPAILTTPVAGGAVKRFGNRPVFWASMGATLFGLGLIATPSLPAVLAGLAAIGAGLFFAQAAATSYVGRVTTHDHAAANGIYLTSYYLGGLAGALVLGQVFAGFGWIFTVGVVAAFVLLACVLARGMGDGEQPSN